MIVGGDKIAQIPNNSITYVNSQNESNHVSIDEGFGVKNNLTSVKNESMFPCASQVETLDLQNENSRTALSFTNKRIIK